MYLQTDSSYYPPAPFDYPPSYSSPGVYSSAPYSSFSNTPSIDDKIQQTVRRVHFLRANAEPFYPLSFQNLDIQGFNSGKITVESYLKNHSYDNLWRIAPHLTKVVVGNAAVEQLPEFPKCKIFICRNNATLKETPDLPRCETLVCINCPNVNSFPTHLPACRQFDCSGCPVEKLPDLPLAQIIKCYYCTKLKSLPVKLENCLKLDCRYCLNLEQLPELPKCVSLLFEGAGLSNIVQLEPGLQIVEIRPGVEVSQLGKVALKIDWDELLASPESILLTLSDCVRLRGEFPIIRFSKGGEVSEAIDAGGPSRQLLTKLFEGLCRSTSKLPSFPMNGKLLPVATNEDEYNSWRAVGCLLRVAFKKEWTIGDHFDDGFFSGLSYLLRTKDWGPEFLIALNPTYSFCKDVLRGQLPAEKDKEKLRCFIALDRDEDLDTYKLPDDVKELYSTVIEAFRRLGDKNYSLVPYADIFEAMKAIKEGFWSFGPPTAPEAEPLKDRIQGVLTKEQIKSSLVFQGFGNHDNQVENLLPEWIDRQDMATLVRFLEAVTSSRTLSSTAKIYVRRVGDNMQRLPVACTCFKRLDIPPYSGKELLARMMATFMEQAMAGTGFQTP